MRRSWDVLVVGGGVIGLSVAREMARRGAAVLVLERGAPAREASWAAAGMLSPFGETSEPGPFLDFAKRALDLWPAFADDLEEESGIGLEYRACGKLRVALDSKDSRRLVTHLEWSRSHGARSEWLDAEALRMPAPGVGSDALAAIRSEDDHRVDNRKTGAALEIAAAGSGAEIRSGAEVVRFVAEGGRFRAVELRDGSRIDAEHLVIAAGCWSGQIPGLPRPIPIRPVRGQMLALAARSAVPDLILESREVYLVPREDGRVLVGATVEEVGFDRGITAGGIRSLLAGAIRLVPALAEAPIAELWSGLRPGTPDRMPLLGNDPDVEGVVHAGGHFRNGILLAPVTGIAVAELIETGNGSGLPEAFRPGRFASPLRHPPPASRIP